MSRIQIDPVRIMVVGDGMADLPMAALAGKTPLQHLHAPHMAQLAGQSGVGMVRTIPEGFPAGTETAMPLITGYDTTVLTGRGGVEAAGMGIDLRPGQFAMRANLVRLDDNDTLIEACPELGDEEGRALGTLLRGDSEMSALLARCGWILYPQPGFRQLITGDGAPPAGMTPPHNVTGDRLDNHMCGGEAVAAIMKRGRVLLRSRGLGVWPWGAGAVPHYEPFLERYGLRGMVVSAVPMVRGMGILAGMEAPIVPGATGSLGTDWRAKVDTVLEAVRVGYMFVMLHIEAPDDCSHALNLPAKLQAIQMVDDAIGLLMEGLRGHTYRILLLPDHITSTDSGKHDDGPVPWCVFDSRLPVGQAKPFVEHFDLLPADFSTPMLTLLERK